MSTPKRRAQAAKPAAPFKPKFFTAHEYATVGVLVDLIIPRDERSGSATDAGVPAFMDFMMIDQPRRQIAMRGGLAMIDRLAIDRFGKRFVSGTDRERRAAARRDRLHLEPRSRPEPGDRVLQQLPRSHRVGILVDEDGRRRSAVSGQRLRQRVERLPGRRAEEAGRAALTTKTTKNTKTHEEDTDCTKRFFFVSSSCPSCLRGL